jgi:RimJ/RimL family protein N-acetyltransferase
LEPNSAFGDVPVFETERLTMRGFDRANFSNFAAVLADPIVAKHIGGKPISREDSWRKYMSLHGSWGLLGFGCWDVFENGSGNYVGYVGFSEYMRQTTPSTEGRPEIGWVLALQAQGKGYATEAAKVALAWGLPRFGGTRPVCIMEPNYPATFRVAEKCGFVKLAMTQYHGNNMLMMEYSG